MAKKFTTAADMFITPVKETPTAGISAQDYTIPQGYILTRENKSERMQLLVRPTTKANLKAEAKAQGISVNDLVNRIFDEYLERQGNK